MGGDQEFSFGEVTFESQLYIQVMTSSRLIGISLEFIHKILVEDRKLIVIMVFRARQKYKHGCF